MDTAATKAVVSVLASPGGWVVLSTVFDFRNCAMEKANELKCKCSKLIL